MRITTLWRRLVDVMSIFVIAVRWDGRALVLDVRPRWLKPRCGECGQCAPGYDRCGSRRWRSLSFGRTIVYLEYALRRVDCRDCGVRVERVPWAEHASWFTRAFEELVAYHVQATDKTTVTKLLGISWEAVGNIVERVVTRRLDRNRLNNVTRIGIDEFSYRKHHRYITVIVDHDTRRVIWTAEGTGAKTLRKFFEELGPERTALLKLATIDMSGGYMKALREHAPDVQIVFDRFHVQGLAGIAVDDVRRELWRSEGTRRGHGVGGTRWALLKNPVNLTGEQSEQLSHIQKTNKPLYRAYLLKEALREALMEPTVEAGRRTLAAWIEWACRSRLKPFVRLSRTIRLHLAGILGYIEHNITNGVVEGINGRMRMVARRAFGFHSAPPLMAMLFLCAGGIQLDPPLPTH